MEVHSGVEPGGDGPGMLAVMEALAAQQRISQRQLAQRTRLSLKKVNVCLHELLQRGHVQFGQVLNSPRNLPYEYVLTPAGQRAKSALAYRLLKAGLDSYNQVAERVCRCLEQMAAGGLSRIGLFGVTEAARIVLDQAGTTAVRVDGILDDGYARTTFCGVLVHRVGVPAVEWWDAVLITALDAVDQAETQLGEAGWPLERIWRLG